MDDYFFAFLVKFSLALSYISRLGREGSDDFEGRGQET
jgi:hypothetical protein